MEAPIEVLRIDQSTVSKEISRFRPCDDETRCFYCRDWAQFIYKKHFVWAAKTQEEVLSQETIIKAGPYELSFLDQDVVPKERATKLAKRFEKLLSKDQARAIDIFEACHLWTKLPSTFSGLPDMFDRIEFNPFPDAIPLTDDPSDPAHLLDPLVIERLSLCLPSDSFHLLKNLTGDILLSHTQPTCDHMKPESKSPAELEVDRIIFNENSVDTINIALKELELALDRAWAPLYLFLEKMEQHEHRRSRLMGSECKTEMDEFVKNQNYTPFVDYWSKNASLFKKKKGVSAADELKNIDKMVEDRLSELQAKGEQFVSEFAVPRLEQIQVLTSDLWKLMVPTFAEMGKRMEKISLEKGGDQPKKLFKQPSQITLDEVDSTKEVKKAKELFIKELRKRIVVHNKEIEELSAYYYEARPELSARVDKLNNKEFKKRVKKVESGYYSIRQFYLEQIVSNLFPDSLFCKCVLYCLEPLMQEGEVMEAMTIEKEIKRFIETHSKMLMNRCQLQDSFEEGVQIGRSELAGILGKLFLKEGMRIQGETLALKRQNTLLKSMGVSETESTQKKKSKKKKGNSSTGPSTPSNPAESPSTPTKQIQEEKPAAPPPLSRAERLRLVVSGTRTSEQKVKDEPKVEKKDSSNEAEENVNVEKKGTCLTRFLRSLVD
ncbi:hypothetical protein K501DRAFT_50400 [Backusella circina FSU 941]|nr:hypothetical protein K501DRAFT_50400 [Backusella circina FSU 941]